MVSLENGFMVSEMQRVLLINSLLSTVNNAAAFTIENNVFINYSFCSSINLIST